MPAHNGTDLVDLSPGLEAVGLVSAAEQLQSLVHVVPGILDLRTEQRDVLRSTEYMSWFYGVAGLVSRWLFSNDLANAQTIVAAETSAHNPFPRGGGRSVHV